MPRMNEEIRLAITNPSSAAPVIRFASHFAVAGQIVSSVPVPHDAVLFVGLYDGEGRLLRHALQTRKNNENLYTAHPDLTHYRAELDPAFEKMKRFGFPELLVEDLDAPERSMRNATIKCFYSDTVFKAIIVTATDKAHGLLLDDGVGFTDERGEPYTVLPRGAYTIRVTLSASDGALLAEAEKPIVIGDVTDQAICRFNPRAHKARMTAWCREIGCEIMADDLPGYLDAYLGTWYYHMGLLPLYRASDVAFYANARVHAFLYLIDPTSTSYETELAFLQTRGVIGDPARFMAYRYDIGEAVLAEGAPEEKRGRVVRFGEEEYLAICRVDTVREGAAENVYELSGTEVIRSQTDVCRVTASVGERLAVMGVVRPRQTDPASFRLKRENVYEVRNPVEKILYEFEDGTICERALMMERREHGESIGFSVYEFYNLFEIPASWEGKTVTVTVRAADREGIYPHAEAVMRVAVSANERNG